MPGPWEKYSTNTVSTEQSGPWSKYRELQSQETSQEPGLVNKGLSALSAGFEYVDRYTGAPVRAGLKEYFEGDRSTEESIVPAIKKAYDQIGRPSSEAPKFIEVAETFTGQPIPQTSISEKIPSIYSETGEGLLKLKKGGLLDPTLRGTIDTVGTIATDPTSYIPFGAVAKSSAKAATSVGKKISPKVVEKIEKGLLAANEGAAKVASKIGTRLGVGTEKEIETYIKNIDEVNKIISKYGENLDEYADDVRDKFVSNIKETRMKMNSILEQQLSGHGGEKVLSIEPIIKRLEASKSRINAGLNPERIERIDEIISRIRSGADENLLVSPKGMHDIKNFLGEEGKSAFMRGGQMFQPGNEISQAARNASSEARRIINKYNPSIANANNKLHELRLIEDKINKNLITSGKSSSALFSAGSGVNKQAEKQLQKLEKITGKGFLADAQLGASAKRYAKPDLLPTDTTGKGLLRTGAVGGIGSIVGSLLGFDPKTSATIAAAMTSPIAFKAAVNAGNISGKMFAELARFAGKTPEIAPEALYKILENKAAETALNVGVATGKAQNRENIGR